MLSYFFRAHSHVVLFLNSGLFFLQVPLPQGIVNYFVRNLAGVLLSNITKKAIRAAKDKNSVYAEAIVADAPFYRDWMLSKLKEYCALKGWDVPRVLALENLPAPSFPGFSSGSTARSEALDLSAADGANGSRVTFHGSSPKYFPQNAAHRTTCSDLLRATDAPLMVIEGDVSVILRAGEFELPREKEAAGVERGDEALMSAEGKERRTASLVLQLCMLMLNVVYKGTSALLRVLFLPNVEEMLHIAYHGTGRKSTVFKADGVGGGVGRTVESTLVLSNFSYDLLLVTCAVLLSFHASDCVDMFQTLMIVISLLGLLAMLANDGPETVARVLFEVPVRHRGSVSRLSNNTDGGGGRLRSGYPWLCFALGISKMPQVETVKESES